MKHHFFQKVKLKKIIANICFFVFQNPDPAQQPLDYYYYDDRDTSKYSNRKGPLYDYGDYYEMDDRIRDIRKNDAIFR